MASNTKKPSSPALDVVARQNNAEVAAKERARTSLAERYKAEEKVTVIGAPMYRAYFGNSMPISINGILVTVPLDGNRYNIPETFAGEFNARINSVNEELSWQKMASDVKSNHESYPGELDLVRQA